MVLKQDWFDFLVSFKKESLPGEISHGKMAPLSRPLSSEAIKSVDNFRSSAVAIHLFEDGNELNILLTERSDYDGHHAGQISFPGGKKEEIDLDLEETARRESFEEVGIPKEFGVTLLELTDIYIPVSKFKVRSYCIYHVLPFDNFVTDPREVKSHFFMSASDLLDESIVDKKNIKIQDRAILKDIPYFDFNNHTIWGATAIILNELKEVLKTNVSD
jgi:8-oxo-dGTP pyrophosphatase MutT (NUDIX family)